MFNKLMVEELRIGGIIVFEGNKIVVPKEELNQQVLIDSMNQYLKQTLANHKLPKAYLLVEELPILENGKRDNVRIRELLDSVNV